MAIAMTDVWELNNKGLYDDYRYQVQRLNTREVDDTNWQRTFLSRVAEAFLFNLVAACQDVATDGLAVRILDTRERGLANGIQVGAYPIGMILGGGLLLWIFARTDWATMFACMAALLALTILPVLPLREPSRAVGEAAPSAARVALGWAHRLRVPGMASFIALNCFYKFGDSMLASLVGPFMRDAGLSKEMIALMKGTVGSGASLAGAALGGWYAFRAGRRRALLACGLLQTASLLGYVAIYHTIVTDPVTVSTATRRALMLSPYFTPFLAAGAPAEVRESLFRSCSMA